MERERVRARVFYSLISFLHECMRERDTERKSVSENGTVKRREREGTTFFLLVQISFFKFSFQVLFISPFLFLSTS